jgi:hypothetical protein
MQTAELFSSKMQLLKMFTIFHSEIGAKFLCSEVIAPIRSEVDDISLFIINFEDLSNPIPVEEIDEPKLSKCKFFFLRILCL